MPKKIHNIEGIEFGTASSNTRYGPRDDSLCLLYTSDAADE